MPTPRKLIVLPPPTEGGFREAQVFHCVSRVVDRNFVFGEAEREEFARVMRAAEGFSGVRVLAWTILSNHFHLLVEVPEKPAGYDLDEDGFWRRLGALYTEEEMDGIRGVMRSLLKVPGGAAGAAMARDYRQRFLDRMLDLSGFMKTLKQRFTIGFNRTHERVGTLWESRFRAVLVEGSPEILMKVSAYIDLNAVRAGMVEDPKDYRWCGYAEALGARKKKVRELAREGLRTVMGEGVKGQGSAGAGAGAAGCGGRARDERDEKDEKDGETAGDGGAAMDRGDEDDALGTTVTTAGVGVGTEAGGGMGSAKGERAALREVLAEYRKLLFGAGDETAGGKGGFTQERVEAIWKAGGKLTLAQLLRCRVRHFSDGLVLGSRAFVNGYFEGARAGFGPRRTSGARKVRGSAGAGLYAVRDLKKAPITGQ